MTSTQLAGTPATWTWFFDTEDEAHMFALGYKDELANEEAFEYDSYDVEYDLKAGSWKLTFRFWDLTTNPADPDDAA